MFNNIGGGDILFPLFSLGMAVLPLILVILVLIFVIRIVKRMERRADQRLNLDKENAVFQQQQLKTINELNNRLTNIENMLKEVE
jgi:Na+-transporting methylmalonyl-CoA/oxaloacetate decarboxylase gamma subunit